MAGCGCTSRPVLRKCWSKTHVTTGPEDLRTVASLLPPLLLLVGAAVDICVWKKVVGGILRTKLSIRAPPFRNGGWRNLAFETFPHGLVSRLDTPFGKDFLKSLSTKVYEVCSAPAHWFQLRRHPWGHTSNNEAADSRLHSYSVVFFSTRSFTSCKT